MKIKEMLKKYWVFIWLIFVSALVFSGIVYADYLKELNRAKRVVANVVSDGQLFDSNYLVTGSPSLKTLVFPKTQTEACLIEVKIYNYFRSNPGKAYQGPLSYQLYAQLVDDKGDLIAQEDLGEHQVGISADQGAHYTYFSTYDATKGYYLNIGQDVMGEDAYIPFEPVNDKYVPQAHVYHLRFPVSFLTTNPGINVRITAVPSNARELSSISAILGVALQGESLNEGWDGAYNENRSNTDYDGFNYVISGSGSATVRLEWDSYYLDFNAYNLSEYGFETPSTETRDGHTWKILEFAVNSSDTLNESGVVTKKGKSRYDFQVYLTADGTTLLEGLKSSAENYWNKLDELLIFQTTLSD